MGLKFSGRMGSLPGLGIAMIEAIFQEIGNWQSLGHLFKILVSVRTMFLGRDLSTMFVN